MSRQEGFVAFAEAFECLQLTGAIEGAVAVVTDIQRDNPDGVTGQQELVALLVIQGKCKDAVQLLQEIDTLVAVESQYHLAVAPGLELIPAFVAMPDVAVVVDFAIHGKHLLAVG